MRSLKDSHMASGSHGHLAPIPHLTGLEVDLSAFLIKLGKKNTSYVQERQLRESEQGILIYTKLRYAGTAI